MLKDMPTGAPGRTSKNLDDNFGFVKAEIIPVNVKHGLLPIRNENGT